MEKEEYAKRLAESAEKCVKALKYLFAAAVVCAVALAGYTLGVYLTGALAEAREWVFIGYIVIVAFLAALVISVIAVFIVAKSYLKKLDGLDREVG